MLALQTLSSEIVLHVNEARSSRRPANPFGRRVLHRRLSAVAARLERSVSYQSSLHRVLAAGEQFQRTLSESQRSSWLALEDALHDHAWRSSRAFFRAGMEMGWKLGNARASAARRRAHRQEREEPKSRTTEPSDETQAVLSLIEIIRRLMGG